MSEEDKQKLAEFDSIKAKLAETETKLASASGELATGRKSKSELEADRDALKVQLSEAQERLKAGGAQPSAEEAVRKVLKEKESTDAVANRKAAEALFKKQYPDFENDPGDIKFAPIKEKLEKFNLTDVVKTEDFLNLLSEAHTLVNPSKPEPKQIFTPYAATPPKSGTGPKEADADNLSTTENDIIKRMGWTKEQYMKQKTKRPHYVEQLLKQLS